MKNESRSSRLACLSLVSLVFLSTLPGCLGLAEMRRDAEGIKSQGDAILTTLATLASDAEREGELSKEQRDEIIVFAEAAKTVGDAIVATVETIEEVGQAGTGLALGAAEVWGGGGLLSLGGLALARWMKESGKNQGRGEQAKEEERRNALLMQLASTVQKAHPET